MVTTDTGSDTNSFEQHCYYHPNVETRLRCSRCEKPICPRCMVSTPVGYRCPDCARGPKPMQYQTSTTGLAKAVVSGIAVAFAVGVIWGLYPAWQFYMVVLLGFGVAEAMAWAANYKRGRELQIAAWGCVLLGIIVSKVVLAWDDPVLTMDLLLNNASQPGVLDAFQLEPIPDYLFLAIPFVIGYIRFK